MATETIKKSTSDKTKDQLINSAAKLFAQKGYAATSVKEIADQAKVNISLVSYHFGGKEGLYKACLEPFVREKTEFFERRILKPTSKADFRLRLGIFIEDVINYDLKHPETGCIIRRDVELNDPILHEIFKKTILEMFNQLIKFIKSGQDAGYLRADACPRTTCVLFMGGIQHAIRTDPLREKLFGETIKDTKTKERLITSALDMFFNGLEAKDIPSEIKYEEKAYTKNTNNEES